LFQRSGDSDPRPWDRSLVTIRPVAPVDRSSQFPARRRSDQPAPQVESPSRVAGWTRADGQADSSRLVRPSRCCPVARHPVRLASQGPVDARDLVRGSEGPPSHHLTVRPVQASPAAAADIDFNCAERSLVSRVTTPSTGGAAGENAILDRPISPPSATNTPPGQRHRGPDRPCRDSRARSSEPAPYLWAGLTRL